MVIVKEQDRCTTEIKRRGLGRDIENVIELRVGDDLVFYWTSGE